MPSRRRTCGNESGGRARSEFECMASWDDEPNVSSTSNACFHVGGRRQRQSRSVCRGRGEHPIPAKLVQADSSWTAPRAVVRKGSYCLLCITLCSLSL